MILYYLMSLSLLATWLDSQSFQYLYITHLTFSVITGSSSGSNSKFRFIFFVTYNNTGFNYSEMCVRSFLQLCNKNKYKIV